MEAFLSFIGLWPLEWAPRYWALCWGDLITINENPSLYSLIGCTYGGDGRSNFALPDFRGRVPLGYGIGPGTMPYPVMGARGGTEGVTLGLSQLPEHTHSATLSSIGVTFMASEEVGTESTPGVNNAKTLGATKAAMGASDKLYNSDTATVELDGISANGGSVAVDNTGEGMMHENRQPYLVTNYIMCLQGIFPPRH